jgi:hypothetical protein
MRLSTEAPKTRSGGLCKHKGNVRNGRCKRHGGASTGATNQAFGRDHHRYVHGLRTKEVIAMRKLVAQINKAMKDLANRSNNTLDKDLSAEEYEVVMHG